MRQLFFILWFKKEFVTEIVQTKLCVLKLCTCKIDSCLLKINLLVPKCFSALKLQTFNYLFVSYDPKCERYLKKYFKPLFGSDHSSLAVLRFFWLYFIRRLEAPTKSHMKLRYQAHTWVEGKMLSTRDCPRLYFGARVFSWIVVSPSSWNQFQSFLDSRDGVW